MRFGKENLYQLVLFVAFGFLILPSTIFAITKSYEQAATPNEVVVIYNSSYTTDSDVNGVQDSLQLANYYRDARLIPNQNIIGIAATTSEAISRAVYNSEIKAPLESALTSAGIASSTKYIVMMKGVPLKIKDSNPAVGDFGEIATSDYSSVDAAVCLLFQNYNNIGVMNNPYYNDPGTSKDYRFKNGYYSNGAVKLNYLVTRLDGYSLGDVVSMIDNSGDALASSTKHFLLDDHVRNEDVMDSAYTKLKALPGVTVNPDPWIDSTSFITTSTEKVVGYTSYGIHATMPQDYYSTTLSLLDWSPGAVSVTYESYNAVSLINPAINNSQGQLAAFIARSGSGGIGNVYEPYASAIARETIWAPAYAIGYNWADAAYMSMQYVDWVSVVVGDPLMVITDNIGPEIQDVTAQVGANNKIQLDWTNPGGDFSAATVVRSTTAYPKNISEGTVICSGSINTCTDNTSTPFVTYYYTVFAVDVNSNYGKGLNSRATISINKNSVYFSLASGTSSESSGLIKLRANFGTAVVGNQSLKISLAGDAVGSEDYVISSTTLNVLGGNNYFDININIIDDFVDGPNKNLIISLVSDDYWVATSNSSYNLTINDNDTFAVNYSISDLFLNEGQTATRTLTIGSQPTHDVTFTFSTSTKYTITPPSFVITPANWNSTTTYNVLANNNYLMTGGSTTTLSLVSTSSDSNYNGLSYNYRVIISDIDVIGIGVDPLDLSLTEGNSKPLNVRLQTKPTDLVTINLSFNSGLALDLTKLDFDSNDWSVYKTVNVTAVNNSARDGSRNVSLSLVASTTDASYVNQSKQLSVAISDDEPGSGGSSSGGGGGGGGSSSSTAVAVPTVVSAVNQNLVLENPSQSGSVNKQFYDSSWIRVGVQANTVSSKTTFCVKSLDISEVNLPVVSDKTTTPINGMIVEVLAYDATSKEINKFSNDLSFEFYLPQIANDDRDLSLYYFDETNKKWILIPNAIYDTSRKIVSFSADHLTKFAVFRGVNREKILSVASMTNEPKVVTSTPSTDSASTISSPSKLPSVKTDKTFSKKQKGKILLQVEGKGEAWYVNPKSLKRCYMANGAEAFKIMRLSGVGISNVNLNKLKANKNLAKKQSGTIFLQVESKGEAWYVGFDGVLYYLKNGSEAYAIMRKLGVGIKNFDLAKIEENK